MYKEHIDSFCVNCLSGSKILLAYKPWRGNKIYQIVRFLLKNGACALVTYCHPARLHHFFYLRFGSDCNNLLTNRIQLLLNPRLAIPK